MTSILTSLVVATFVPPTFHLAKMWYWDFVLMAFVLMTFVIMAFVLMIFVLVTFVLV